MNINLLHIPEVKIITPDYFPDFRGYTSISFDANTEAELGFQISQINHGYSTNSYTLRGLHYQELP